MKAGRELDALVAEKVMGWCWIENDVGQESLQPPIEEYAYLSRNHPVFWADDKGYTEIMPKYSTNIADAWQVVEKLRETHWIQVEVGTLNICDIGEYGKGCSTIQEVADTIPLAICLAALKAVGVELD